MDRESAGDGGSGGGDAVWDAVWDAHALAHCASHVARAEGLALALRAVGPLAALGRCGVPRDTAEAAARYGGVFVFFLLLLLPPSSYAFFFFFCTHVSLRITPCAICCFAVPSLSLSLFRKSSTCFFFFLFVCLFGSMEAVC
jgi:hypothetical protein